MVDEPLTLLEVTLLLKAVEKSVRTSGDNAEAHLKRRARDGAKTKR
jgi:hypothetical protein